MQKYEKFIPSGHKKPNAESPVSERESFVASKYREMLFSQNENTGSTPPQVDEEKDDTTRSRVFRLVDYFIVGSRGPIEKRKRGKRTVCNSFFFFE